MVPVDGWRAGNDAMEVREISLRLGERFAAALRAADKIRSSSVLAVEGVYQSFRLYRCFVNRALAKSFTFSGCPITHD